MKSTLFCLLLSLLLLNQSFLAQNKSDMWKGNKNNINTAEELTAELNEKYERLNKFLDEKNLAGMLFTQVRNVNWITAGRANTQIVLNKDVGAASLLVMKNGKKYLVCNASESERLLNEDLQGLGYELQLYNWYESNNVKDTRGDMIKSVSEGLQIGSDIPFPGTVEVSQEFAPLRYSFTDSEIKRYKWLAKECTEAVAEVCKSVKPGMNEFEIEYMTSNSLMRRGILPTVLLIGVDERIYNYRHCLPGGEVLQKYAMVNVVAEKWGMPVAVTRFVHFGDLPKDLEEKLNRTAVVNARYLDATIPGKNVGEIFKSCMDWYAKGGYGGEWRKHHQGGAIGYDDREYVIFPGVDKIIRNNQPFAWNPTITGAKVEDTILATEKGAEVLTTSDGWPLIVVELNGKKYSQPAILIRNQDGSETKQLTVNLKAD